MKVIITGAGGMLGSDLLDVFKKSDEHKVSMFRRNELDISDRDQVLSVVTELRPDVIINAAAYTDVDGCEINREMAFAVNAEGPKHLAEASRSVGATLIHVSTDYVFSGDHTQPYQVEEECHPKSVYGQSKWAGEETIRHSWERHFILRTSWLYGLHGKNFVTTMLRVGKKESTVRVVNDQIGSPTFSWDLAQAIISLLESDKYGTYHVTNQGFCTWNDFSKLIFSLEGMKVDVLPITTGELGRPAPRPAYSVLDHHKWIEARFPSLRHYDEALQDYLQRWHELNDER